MLFKKTDRVLNTNVSFSIRELERGHHNVTYRGVKCIKSPFDYTLYQMLLHEVQPDLIIEIGSHEGGSAFYLADLLEIYQKGVIHTIDIQNRIDERVKNHPRINFFHDGWEKYDLNLARNFSSVLVIEDSSHTYDNTLKVINKFSQVVSTGSYLIVEDGIINKLSLSKKYNGGPVKAIKEFLGQNKNFEIEHKWTDFFGKNATFNTIGYLKKVA